MENHNRLQISLLQTLDLRNSASWETKSCQRKTGKFKSIKILLGELAK